MAKKKKKSRKAKISLIFDKNERKDYLLGFRKRNLEKKMKMKEKYLQKLKEEKKRLKKEKHEAINAQLYVSSRAVPEVDHLVEPVTYETDNHFVTITQLDANEIGGDINLTLGANKGFVK